MKRIWKTGAAREKALKKSARRMHIDLQRAGNAREGKATPEPDQLDLLNRYLVGKKDTERKMVFIEMKKQKGKPLPEKITSEQLETLLAETEAKKNMIAQMQKKLQKKITPTQAGQMYRHCEIFLDLLSRTNRLARKVLLETPSREDRGQIRTIISNTNEQIAKMQMAMGVLAALKRTN